MEDASDFSDDEGAPAEKKMKMKEREKACLAKEDAQDIDAVVSDDDDDEGEDGGSDKDDSESDFSDVDTDAEEDGTGSAGGTRTRRRLPTPEEREAFEHLQVKLGLPTKEELRGLRKGLLHVYKLISSGQGDPGAMLRIGYNWFYRGYGVAPTRVAPLIAAAQAIATNVRVPTQALEDAFAPFSQFSGGRLVKAARHVHTFFALATLSIMVEKQQKVDERGSSDAQDMMLEVLRQRGLDGDAAQLLSMDFAAESDELASAKAAGKALARELNELTDEERMRQLFFNLAQFVPADPGAAAAAASNRTRRDRGCDMMFDSPSIKGPSAHALSVGMQRLVLEFVAPDASRMSNSGMRARCLEEPFQQAINDAAHAQNLFGDFDTKETVYPPYEPHNTTKLWKGTGQWWVPLCKVAHTVEYVNPASNPTDPNYQTYHTDTEPRKLREAMETLMKRGSFGAIREGLLNNYRSDDGALFPNGTLVFMSATTERASLKGDVPEHADLNVNRLQLTRSPCQAIGKGGYRSRTFSGIFDMKDEAPTNVLQVDQYTTTKEIVGLFVRSMVAFSRGTLVFTFMPPCDYAALGVKPRVTKMPKLRIANRDAELREMTRNTFPEEALHEMEEDGAYLGFKLSKAQRALLKKRIDAKRDQYVRDNPIDTYAIDTGGLVNRKELPLWKLEASGWFASVRAGPRQIAWIAASKRVNEAFKKRADEYCAGLASVNTEKAIAPGGSSAREAGERFAANAASMAPTA